MKRWIETLGRTLFGEIIAWASACPVLSHTLNTLTTLACCSMAASFEGMAKVITTGFVWIAASITLFTLVTQWRRSVLALLTALLLHGGMARAHETPPPDLNAGLAVGCVLVVGGVAVIAIYVVPFCKKHFDKPKVKPVEELLGATGEEGDSYAAMSCPHYKENCDGGSDLSFHADPQASDATVAVHLSGRVRVDGGAPTIERQRIERGSAKDIMDYEAWRVDLALEHGLIIGGGLGGGVLFGKRGRPATADEVPVRFGPGNSVQWQTDRPVYTVRAERSFDLEQWTPLAEARLMEGQQFHISDMSGRAAAFYRMAVVNAP